MKGCIRYLMIELLRVLLFGCSDTTPIDNSNNENQSKGDSTAETPATPKEYGLNELIEFTNGITL